MSRVKGRLEPLGSHLKEGIDISKIVAPTPITASSRFEVPVAVNEVLILIRWDTDEAFVGSDLSTQICI